MKEQDEDRHNHNKIYAGVIAAIGATLCIWTLASIDKTIDYPYLLIASFGATMVLIFGVHQSPLSQPKNVIFGHIVTAAVGLAFSNYFSSSPPLLGLAVGLGIFFMIVFDVTHPPAGGNPLIIMLGGHTSWYFLLHPILLGTVLIVSLAIIYHKFIPGHTYPLSKNDKDVWVDEQTVKRQ